MDTVIVIIEWVTFIVFLYILWRLVNKPVTNMLRQRSERIESRLVAAEESQSRASEMQQEAQRQLEQAHAEAQHIAASASKAAEAQRQTLVAQAEQDAAAVVTRARAEIERERQAAVDELRREASRLAVTVAEAVVSSGLDEAATRDLTDRAIADVGGTR